MTEYEKALKELKRQVKYWQKGKIITYTLPPLKIAISALEKQIPKKQNCLNLFIILLLMRCIKYGKWQIGVIQMTELKPCPFCGERNRIHIRRQGNHAYRVICHSCGALGPYAKVEKWHINKLIAQGNAKKLWNTRCK